MGLTLVDSKMISAGGAPDETPILARGGKLTAGRTEAQAEITDESSYDEASGILTLVFASGKRVRIEGFPTIGDIPEGRIGQRGETGADGRDGKDGRDGEKGEAGCQGIQGEQGEQGDMGEDGRQGQRGEQGAVGATGAKGLRGDTGAQGKRGDTGPTGATGAAGPTGATGATGAAGIFPIIVSTTEPHTDKEGIIWLNPSIVAQKMFP